MFHLFKYGVGTSQSQYEGTEEFTFQGHVLN
jgi:hypothetical protein